MESVHLFISSGRFKTFGEMRSFVEESYDENGEATDSEFGKEVGLTDYEPGCIECIESPTGNVLPAKELLALAHRSDCWLDQIEEGLEADAVICVCKPNKVLNPEGTSLTYLGEYKIDDN